MGDSIRKMQVGDFMFIGSNLPHLWLSSDEYYEAGTTLKSRSIYTQFNVDIFPENMFNIPELAPIDTLIKASEKGVLFLGDNIDHFKKNSENWLTNKDSINGMDSVNCSMAYRPNADMNY